MKQLEHFDPTGEDRTAHAPYNFVQLPAAVAKPIDAPADQDRYYVDHGNSESNAARHTGHLECVLTTASPLYTRCGIALENLQTALAQGKEAQAKDLADFLTNPATLEPMIAGSSIRGMLRTLVEIVGHGKMTNVTERQLFYRTMDDSNVGRTYGQRVRDKIRGGIFHTDGQRYWIETCMVGRIDRNDLQEAITNGRQFYDGRRPNLVPQWRHQHSEIWVKTHPQAAEDLCRFRPVSEVSRRANSATPQKGILVLTGDIPKKKKEFVFIRGSYGRVEVAEKDYRRFHDDDQLSQWQEKAFPTDQPTANARQRPGYLANGEPVFYLCDEDNRVIFFGRAGHFRLPYKQSPLAMVPPALRSRTEKDLDIAEAIFGYVDLADEQGKETARGGRVFVCDARLQGATHDIWHDEIHPQVLSSPKPTSIQLYLTQKYPDFAKELFHYDSSADTETTLRGHKLYWHKGDVSINQIQEKPERVAKFPKQYTRIRPIKSGVRFCLQHSL